MSGESLRFDDGTRVRWHLLTSVPFFLSLALLGLNDWVLKAAFHNALTGKLSDLAGLFALGVFLCAFASGREARALAALAGAYIAWKSPLADPLIGWWNELPLFDVARVVDYTDLVGLAVLPIAARFATGAPRRRVHRVPAYAMTCAALVLFTATSTPKRVVPFDHAYRFDMPVAHLAVLLERYREPETSAEHRPRRGAVGAFNRDDRLYVDDDVHIWLPDNQLHAVVRIGGGHTDSRLSLRGIALWSYEEEDDDPIAMLLAFEEELIEPLRAAAADSVMMTAVRLTEYPRRLPARWAPFDFDDDPIVFGLHEYAAQVSDTVTLVFGSHSEEPVTYVSCAVRRHRFDGRAWTDVGDVQGMSRCWSSPVVLERDDVRHMAVHVDWQPGIWRLAARFETAGGDTTLFTEPLIVSAEAAEGGR